MSRHFVVDLDRTLFQTGKFAPKLHRWIETEYGISAGTLEREQTDFYVYSDDLYAYDLFTHLLSHHIDTDTFSKKLLRSDFADDAYLFLGAQELLDECLSKGSLTILSFGHDNYQRLKYNLCPTIVSRASLITTLVPKYKMLHTVAEGSVTVIDDKPIGDQLPETVEFIQALPEATVLPTQPWPVYNSLEEITAYIHNSKE